MTQYRIHPLQAGEIGASLGVLAMMEDMQTVVMGPVYIFYLEGGPEKILVDAGMPASGYGGLTGGEKAVSRALSDIGIKPEEIDVLVLTHLHFDHCAAVHIFKNARIIVQKKEWEAAADPLPVMQSVYDPALIRAVERMNPVLVDGDYEIAPGVSTLLLPGHTEGLQGLSVSTRAGTYVLAGDLAYGYYNIDPTVSRFTDAAGNEIELVSRPGWPFIPPGLHTSLEQWFSSMHRALSIVEGDKNRIIPGHDPVLTGKIFG